MRQLAPTPPTPMTGSKCKMLRTVSTEKCQHQGLHSNPGVALLFLSSINKRNNDHVMVVFLLNEPASSLESCFKGSLAVSHSRDLMATGRAKVAVERRNADKAGIQSFPLLWSRHCAARNNGRISSSSFIVVMPTLRFTCVLAGFN